MKFFTLALFISSFLVFNLSALQESQQDKKEEADNKEEDKKEKKEENDKKEAGKKSDNNSSQKGTEEAEKTLKIGNLAFPVSQQPTPLLSFGQNLLDKKQAQATLLATQFKGDDQYFINIVPTLLYGFADNFSIYLSAPFAVRYRQKNQHSSGPGDAIIQLEYAFYTKAYRTYYDQATILTSVTIPTGSTKKNPNIGIGSNSFFIGGTYSRMEVDWFYFTSQGGIITTSSHRIKHGNQFLYQFGLGRRIANTKEWLFAWMLEFNGIYSWKDKIQGVYDKNSGGNVIYLTPSLWISSIESLIVQLGVSVPIYQHLFGNQIKNDYAVELNLGWTF